MLVPTTLLANQHGQTFRERFANYPVRAEVLSRFLTAREQAAVVNGVTEGSVDVVIATHRLLSGDVRFKDLGLLVVDEEQRFGVQHKELVKQPADVDVLTLTATPIPRTLEMSLTGIRDLSLVNTPPEDRQPILTYVGEFDDRAAAEAIRRELLREGQVFFVHNRVQDIDFVSEQLRELVLEARIGVAHGQMDEGRLERVVLDFWEREYDVLVCTTIVESGLDIPTVNTLVVDRSDLLGLAQCTNCAVESVAVASAPMRTCSTREQSLTEEAYERLKTIGEFTDLGSGFKIAMRDLEIRGRQHARRRAVRPHRRRRIRPLLPARHRGGRGAEGRDTARSGRGDDRRPRRRLSADRVPVARRRAHGGVPAAGRSHDAGRRRRHPGRVAGPVRATPGPGGGLLDVARLRAECVRTGMRSLCPAGRGAHHRPRAAGVGEDPAAAARARRGQGRRRGRDPRLGIGGGIACRARRPARGAGSRRRSRAGSIRRAVRTSYAARSLLAAVMALAGCSAVRPAALTVNGTDISRSSVDDELQAIAENPGLKGEISSSDGTIKSSGSTIWPHTDRPATGGRP